MILRICFPELSVLQCSHPAYFSGQGRIGIQRFLKGKNVGAVLSTRASREISTVNTQIENLGVKPLAIPTTQVYSANSTFLHEVVEKAPHARIQNKCINLLTQDGKKTKAFSLLKTALSLVLKKTKNKTKPIEIVSTGAIALRAAPTPFGGSHGKGYTEASPPSPFGFVSMPVTQQNSIEKKKALGLSSTSNDIFFQSIANVKPIFEVKKVRIAGNTVLVPALIPFQRQENKALRWIIEAASARKKKNPNFVFEECLAIEILEAFQSQGYAKQKRDELHKIAEANRAFAHYKWW